MYLEHRPGSALRAFVECFWTREPSHPAAGLNVPPVRVWPDGCVDLVFASLQPGVDDWTGQAVGAMTRPFLVAHGRSARFVAVRSRPGGAFPFLRGQPAAELTDTRVDLSELWGRDAAGQLGDELFDRGVLAPAAQVARLEAALSQRLRGTIRSPAPWVGRAVAALRERSGKLRVEDLGAELGLSRQHLARVFQAQVGLSPKQLARIYRLRRLLKEARRQQRAGRAVNWSALAFDFGYCDQAHLSGESRALTGLSPGQHLVATAINDPTTGG